MDRGRCHQVDLRHQLNDSDFLGFTCQDCEKYRSINDEIQAPIASWGEPSRLLNATSSATPQSPNTASRENSGNRLLIFFIVASEGFDRRSSLW